MWRFACCLVVAVRGVLLPPASPPPQPSSSLLVINRLVATFRWKFLATIGHLEKDYQNDCEGIITACIPDYIIMIIIGERFSSSIIGTQE